MGNCVYYEWWIEPIVLESANWRTYPKSKPTIAFELFSKSLLWGEACKLRFYPFSGCDRIHVYFSHSPFHDLLVFFSVLYRVMLDIAVSFIIVGKKTSRFIQDYSSYVFDFVRLLLVCWGCYVISLYNFSYLCLILGFFDLDTITFEVSAASRSIWSWTSWAHLTV